MENWSGVQERVRALEEAALRAALEAASWCLSGAARALAMPYSSLQAVLRRHPELAGEIPGRRAACERAAPGAAAKAAARSAA